MENHPTLWNDQPELFEQEEYLTQLQQLEEAMVREKWLKTGQFIVDL